MILGSAPSVGGIPPSQMCRGLGQERARARAAFGRGPTDPDAAAPGPRAERGRWTGNCWPRGLIISGPPTQERARAGRPRLPRRTPRHGVSRFARATVLTGPGARGVTAVSRPRDSDPAAARGRRGGPPSPSPAAGAVALHRPAASGCRGPRADSESRRRDVAQPRQGPCHSRGSDVTAAPGPPDPAAGAAVLHKPAGGRGPRRRRAALLWQRHVFAPGVTVSRLCSTRATYGCTATRHPYAARAGPGPPCTRR